MSRLLAVGLAAALGAGLLVSAPSANATSGTVAPAKAAAVKAKSRLVSLCPTRPAKGHATCFAVAKVAAAGAASRQAGSRATPGGLTPADLWSAYRLPSLTAGAGAGQTIAIVDAYGYPSAEADLAVYRAQFGLPACTTANGCFRKVNQKGTTTYPPFSLSWAQETGLDLDAASAVCPKCKLLLVQASSSSFTDLGVAVNTAVQLGATVVSNSYGGDDASDTTFGKYYRHPGVPLTASTGDNGYEGASYPASSSLVTAVGGTTLLRSGTATRGWTETAWIGSGSGCSSFNHAIPGSAAAGTGCTRRAMSDVSAVGDPDTGLAVYARTTKYAAEWQVFGGTSASAPIIAGVFALAGNGALTTPSYPYAHRSALFDVTVGSNGPCPVLQWCTARTGWDGPTGLGTPNGVGAF